MLTIENKLARIKNRHSKYELCAEGPQGKFLAGYTRHGKYGILSMIHRNSNEWLERIGQDIITFDSSHRIARIGEWKFYFTGRTQREAIIQGELVWFADADKGIKNKS